MFGTMASTVLTSAVVGGALVLEGVLMFKGALERERDKARKGC
jgi:uncharacterized membrane protein HdeD (DUF308 family)